MSKKKKKQILNNLDWYKLRKRIEKGDDHTSVILCASYIDYCFDMLVKNALVGSEKIKNELLSDGMPLSTFSAKSKIAFCLNLIPENIFEDITIVRKIRNKYAHQIDGLSFNDEPIKTWCESLTSYSSITSIGISEEILSNPRGRFIVSSTLIMNELERRAGFLSPNLKKALSELKSSEPNFEEALSSKSTPNVEVKKTN